MYQVLWSLDLQSDTAEHLIVGSREDCAAAFAVMKEYFIVRDRNLSGNPAKDKETGKLLYLIMMDMRGNPEDGFRFVPCPEAIIGSDLDRDY